MVYVEQPVGVGFSVAASAELDYGDGQAAGDNYRFVTGFFEQCRAGGHPAKKRKQNDVKGRGAGDGGTSRMSSCGARAA